MSVTMLYEIHGNIVYLSPVSMLADEVSVPEHILANILEVVAWYAEAFMIGATAVFALMGLSWLWDRITHFEFGSKSCLS